jgi:hypothetical protein
MKPSINLPVTNKEIAFDNFITNKNQITPMKKLITNSNPFILLLIPVFFAIIMGVSYQFQQKKAEIVGTSEHATSLFFKGISLVKTVCAVAKDKVW